MRWYVLLVAALLCMAAAPISIPLEDRRPPDQTFLTGPEWFLVFSPAEYADYLQHQGPSEFPFYGHLRQFWQGYRAVTRASSEFGFNGEYHVMIMVIGVSTSVEYGLKGLYEAVVGHFTEAVAGVPDTAEDRLNAATAQSYVEFIKEYPWYDFDFLTPLKKLWTETGWWGDKPLRKWERKYFLTGEYLVKAAYGWALGKATHATFEKPIERTAIIVDQMPIGSSLPDGVRIEERGESEMLLALPRYQPFTDAAQHLAAMGVNFHEIAGNRGDIMVTVISANGLPPGTEGRLIYRQAILTHAGHMRYAIAYPVADLAQVLRAFGGTDVIVEHIYDF